MKRIWIGTSGWVYKEWAGHFYPTGLPKKDEFRYYARHFPTVEINATFYRLPTLKTVRGWREKSPEGFVFAVKGSRFLTHIKRLSDTSRGLNKYFSRLAPLGDRMGPVLWQLPPNFLKTAETMKRLERFLDRLPRRYRHAIEFRHPSWLDDETHSLLRERQAANVWISSLRMPADYTITTDFVYLRFHGLKDGPYHDYTADELRPWAKQLTAAARKSLPAYVYFNNDLNTRAPLNAEALMQLVSPHAAPPCASSLNAQPVDPPARSRATRRSSSQRESARAPGPAKSKRSKELARKTTPPGQAGVRRFAAAAFSVSALPPTH